MKKKRFLISLIIIVIIIIITICWLGNRYLYSLAYHQLYDAAVEMTGCEGNECNEPITNAIQILKDKYQLTQAQVMRCRGADVLEEKDFAFLTPVKNQIVEWIYKTCASDEVNLDDANIEIYNFPSSSHEE